jgi:hypothetical protein
MVNLREGLARPRPTIPIADAPALRRVARRTSVARLGLALLLLLGLGACVWLAGDFRTRPSSYFAAGGGGIVVLDLSTSVDPARYRRLARVLRTIVETGQPVGLVAYSDSAYEMLPPGTRGDELRPLLRFFEPPSGDPAQARRARGFGFLESPWAGSFRGGTRISTGLRVAREMVARDGLAPATVVLVSDLDDSPFDTARLGDEAIRYRRAGIDLRLVTLSPSREDRDLFMRLMGPRAFVDHRELLANSALEERRTLVGSFPVLLVLVAAALLLLLAANERVNARLRWRRAA